MRHLWVLATIFGALWSATFASVACAAEADAASSGVEVILINQVTPSQVCTTESHTLTLFLSAGSQENLAYQDTYGPFQAPELWGKFQFGLQENSWFWIPTADPSHQDPDNAGMQVVIDDASTCTLSTATSLAGPDTPDARQVIEVTGQSTGVGQCTITVTRKTPPSLYPTKDCCAPPQFSPSCASLGIQRGQNATEP